jgi:hypothetical protein
MTHKLKTWTEFYRRIVSREKKFELRKNDRDYQVGDILILQEYFPNLEKYSGEETAVRVVYILHGPAFGIEKDYCVMSIQNIAD